MTEKEGVKMLQVEKNVPLPKKYPFDEMEVGDSFELLDTMKRNTVNIAARRYGDKTGKKFVVRTKDKKLRCWRLA